MTDTYCPNFTYLGHLFTLLELEDQNETIFISDDTDYIVTRVENAWLMHHVHDNEPVMFGLIPHSATSPLCPDKVDWYWSSTMDRVEYEEKEKECSVEIVGEPHNLSDMITNEFDSGLLFNFEEESDIEISVLFPMNLSIDKIQGNVDSLEKNGLTNIVLLKSGELRSLILFNLTAEERQMINAA